MLSLSPRRGLRGFAFDEPLGTGALFCVSGLAGCDFGRVALGVGILWFELFFMGV